MIAVFADTHETDSPQLSESADQTLEDAEYVVHAGDFTTPAVHDAFDRRAEELLAVQGNSDTPALCDRLPRVRTVDWEGWTLLVTHGHEHDSTTLPLLGREREADLAIVGHTHRPGIEEIGGLPVVNPGSHADPRGGPPTYAQLQGRDGRIAVDVRNVEGESVSRRCVDME
ncbi:metallophosphoesterase [Halorhabdus sp. CBA1104]|uniref:metallophosphoesterase n=1 Tax=unclassified Halorhabdus TaxID=2621901 RepID=UPI0012B2741B|nr:MULTISPECIES: metallophosphoesterase [unclassified Halorhabdus]QGN08109.1 metallophosphoesterase [Halorhabdus sp. CBA1104]